MRIGIDISVLSSKWDGIGTYVYNQLKFLLSQKGSDRFFLYTDKPLCADLALDERFTIRVGPGQNHLLWMLTALPRYVRQDHLDVLWQPNFVLPFKAGKTRHIVTVHDMSAYAFSGYASVKTNIVHKLFLKKSCREASLILAISQNGRDEIVRHLGIPEDKIRVIYLGARIFENGLDADEDEVREALARYGLAPGEYMLFVGTISPRKNIEVIVRAYELYRMNGGTARLVLAGGFGAKSANIRKQIAGSSYTNDIVLTGYVPEETKRIFYYHASMLLFPSRLEGYGYPLLEAMRAEIPIITSNVSCMPEIAQEAAVYLNDIDNPEELARHMFEVERMPLEQKEEMIRKGRERLAFFEGQNGQQQTFLAICEAAGLRRLQRSVVDDETSADYAGDISRRC